MQAIISKESAAQKHIVNCKLVEVLTVDAVKIAHNIWRIASEHIIIALVRVVALGFKQRGGKLLDSLAVLHHSTLELRKRVSPNLALDNHVADSVHKRVDKLIHHRAILKQVVHGIGNISLRGGRDSLLISERRIGANRIEDLRIGRIKRFNGFSCHCSCPPSAHQ